MSIESITLIMAFASGLFMFLAYKVPEEKIWMPFRVFLILIALATIPLALKISMLSLDNVPASLLYSLNLAFNVALIVTAVSLLYVMGVVIYYIAVGVKETEEREVIED